MAIGAGAGVGAVALSSRGSGSRPHRRPPTPSVAAFPFPTHGTIQPVAVESDTATDDGFVELASPRAALEDFLAAERDGLTARSFRLLTSADQQDVGSAAAWTAAGAQRPEPLTFAVTAEQPGPGGDEISVDVTRHPSLDQFAGFVSGRATQVWDVVPEGATWRVRQEPVADTPALPNVSGAVEVAQRWVQAAAACNRAAASSLEGVTDLLGPEDLLAAPCAERGSWTVAGPAVTLDRAPDTETLVEAYGPDVGTWARLVPVRGPRSHFFAAVAPLGEDWRVVGVTTDGR